MGRVVEVDLRAVLDKADAQLDVAQVVEEIDPLSRAPHGGGCDNECTSDGDEDQHLGWARHALVSVALIKQEFSNGETETKDRLVSCTPATKKRKWRAQGMSMATNWQIIRVYRGGAERKENFVCFHNWIMGIPCRKRSGTE